MNLAKELHVQELRQAVVGTSKGYNVVCEHCGSRRTNTILRFSMDGRYIASGDSHITILNADGQMHSKVRGT